MIRQRGFTLVETMIAMLLMAIIVVAVLSGLASMSLAAARHQQITTLDQLVRSEAEYIKSQTYEAKPNTYSNLAALPSGYSFAVTIAYWNAASKTFATTNADAGLQELKLVASGPNGIQETLYVLKVKP